MMKSELKAGMVVVFNNLHYIKKAMVTVIADGRILLTTTEGLSGMVGRSWCLLSCNLTNDLEYSPNNNYNFVAVETADGESLWKRGMFKKGEIVEVSDNGEVWYLRRFYKQEESLFKMFADGADGAFPKTGNWLCWVYCRKPN